MKFKNEVLDYAMVPASLLFLTVYHAWLFYRIRYHPYTTVIGINAINRRIWVDTIMSEGLKHGVLAVQTMRNHIMASTVLASMAITLSSIIGVLVSSTSGSGVAASFIVGAESSLVVSIKYFSILVCFLTAFLCNVQSIRYYTHVSILIAVGQQPSSREYVSRALNRGSHFWSMGLRAFYYSFPLFLWTFGPIPMFVCCCFLVCILYFLDTASPSAKFPISPSDEGAQGKSVNNVEPIVIPSLV